MTNDEQLNLLVTQQGAIEAANQLKQLAAAQATVVAATKAQDQAARQEQKSLLDLEREVEKVTELYDKYAAAKEKAAKDKKPSGGGGGSDNVSKVTGAAGRALGSLSSEAGGRLNDLQDILEFRKTLSEISKTAAAAGVGIGVATLALAALTAQAQKAKEAAQGELNQREQFIGFLQTATKEELDTKVKGLQDDKRVNQAMADDANNQLQAIRDAIRKQFGDAGLAVAEVNAKLGTGAPELAAAIQNADTYNKKLNETNTTLDLATQAQEANATANNDSAAAAKKAADAERELAVARAENAVKQNDIFVQAQLQAAQLAQNGTEAQVQAALDAAAVQKKIYQESKTRLENEQKAYAEGTDEYKAYQASIESTQQKLTELDTSMILLAGDTLQAAKANDAAAAAQKYAADQAKELADATKKYNEDIAAINQKDAESRDKLRDALTEIFDQAVKAAQDAYAKLVQARADLAKDLGREEDKAARDAAKTRIENAIKENEQEQDIYKAYRRKLRDIQRQEDEASFEAALNRDFSSLFNIGRNANSQRSQAAQDERDRIEDARTAYQRQNDELVRSLENERQERLIAYQQRIADAIDAYNRERLQIDAQRKDAEAKAQAARVKEKAALDQAYANRLQAAQNELALISQTEQQRVAIMAAAQNALITQARALLSATSGGSTGAGASGTSLQFSQTNNITGNDPQQIANLVDQRTTRAIKKLIGQ